MKSFVKSQFVYSPLVWMFHDRGSNNKITRVHERALRFVYKYDRHTFEELLIRDNSVTIHHRNMHAVAIEMFKSLNNVQIDLIGEIFIKIIRKKITARLYDRLDQGMIQEVEELFKTKRGDNGFGSTGK